MRIDGRVFIVTGASSGIGLATARALSARGGKIASLPAARRRWKISRGHCPKAFAVTADMTDFQAVASGFSRKV